VDSATFANRLHEASQWARDFGQGFVEEELPLPLVFRVRLNASYYRGPDRRVFG